MMNRHYLWLVLLLLSAPVVATQCKQPLPNYLSQQASLSDTIKGMTLTEIQALAKSHGVFQFALGGVYEYGLLEVNKDSAQAFVWYTKAAEQHITAAAHQLGLFYLFCQDGKVEDAIYWFLRGNKKQMYPENLLYISYAMAHFSNDPKEQNEGLINLKKLADKQYAPAMYEYAAMLWSGNKVAQDQPAACQLMQTLKQRHHRRAFYDLALCHQSGIGVAKDNSQYKQLLQQSATFGDVRAINSQESIKG